jgi:peptide subunit release factor 1 (eRF1)
MSWKYSKNYKPNGRKKKTVAKEKEKLQREYGMLCAQMGEAQFHIELLKEKLQSGNMQLLAIAKQIEEAGKELAGAQSNPSANPIPVPPHMAQADLSQQEVLQPQQEPSNEAKAS